jgi:hypothetical protein
MVDRPVRDITRVRAFACAMEDRNCGEISRRFAIRNGAELASEHGKRTTSHLCATRLRAYHVTFVRLFMDHCEYLLFQVAPLHL